ncbi:MAG: Adenosylcobalamin/alpha-ribazole phosphatase [Chlamydiae bacterium]|nr:Adenosylcobalamin/alpha-ribazole phosphatase [Chlamydiota bacterium]
MKSFHQKVYLVRHGETEWTIAKKHTGLTDIPLTDEGRLQAEWLKGKLEDKKFKKVFCSSLERARETCKIAGFSKEAIIDEDLLEWNYGDYEGKTLAEIHETDPKWTIFSKGAPNGESLGDIATRANRVISRVRDIPGDVALFSSGHFSRALAARWLQLHVAEGRLFLLSTASISILGYEHETPVLVTWNET